MAASDQQVKDFIAQNFPTYSWVLGVPELYDVFKNAVTGEGVANESSAQLVSQLQNTSWWKTHGSAMRQYMDLQQTDPDTLAEQVAAKDADVHQMANKMGLPDNAINIDQMARNAIQFGWDDAELQEQLAGQAQYNAAAPETSNLGVIDNSMQQLKANAAGYMVSLNDQTAFQWSRDIAAGHHTIDDYTPQLAAWAKGRFPTLSSQIDAGITPQQYFQPMQQETAKLLEVAPDSIDLANDARFSKIVNYSDPKTGAPRPMTMAESQSYVRSMDQWKSTSQAQQSASDMSEGILQLFGKVASGSGNSNLSGPANSYAA